ncbi:flagellar hook-associated protein FlgK [Arthrobacter sp. CAN_A1]|uniref:flagellar hook-associated protein FlgK n=1 Tax=Arthrobacter sp. CAN_A1 TaxID=2787717 RepID=UPI0018CB9371
MSTFSGLNTAYSGLVAARHGLDVVGQNISNANTEGYTRQRVTTGAVGAPATGLFSTGVRAGQGVVVNGVARLGDAHLDAQVRVSLAGSGFSSVQAATLSTLEGSLNEPGDNGMSASLQNFWSAWQGLSNDAGGGAPSAVLLREANALSAHLAQGYQAAAGQWSQLRQETTTMVAEVNTAATQVADLNNQVRKVLAAGGSANELIDQRNTLVATISALTGASMRQREDGTVDVVMGGNSLVTGDSVRTLAVAGPGRLDAAGTDAVRVEFTHRPGTSAGLDGGEIAGALSALAPAATGGALAEAATFYNDFASSLAAKVNAVHSQGATTDGTTGIDFFAIGDPAALNLTVVPVDASGIAAGTPGGGGLNGGNADAISQLGSGADSPDVAWAGFVTQLGLETKAARQTAVLADLAASSSIGRQLSNSSVDMDEENLNLLAHQHAYQGAARVITAIDEMLDTLINRTGVVGR